MNHEKEEFGDDAITKLLYAKNRLDYIFEIEPEWVLRVKKKIIKWMKILFQVLNSKKVHNIRKISSRLSSRLSSRNMTHR